MTLNKYKCLDKLSEKKSDIADSKDEKQLIECSQCKLSEKKVGK